MSLHILSLPKLALQRRASAILGLIIIAMFWTGLVLALFADRSENLREVERRNENFALLFEESLLRSIGEIDKSLLYLRRAVEAAPTADDYWTVVQTTDVLSEIIVQMAVIDAKGIARGTNAKPPPPRTNLIDISDREHFKAHVGSDTDRLFISKPLIGRASNKWSVQFTRRFTKNDQFGGVVVASMDPSHFTSFFDKVDLGAATSVALVGEDGVVRSAGGGATSRFSLGDSLAGTALFDAIRAATTNFLSEEEAKGGDAMLVSSRRVRGHPLYVMVTTDQRDIYRQSWSNLQRNILIVCGLTILILVALEQIFRAEARASLKASQLQLTLEHISQGIMLVTDDRTIPIINRQCGTLLRLPPGMTDKQPSFDELARYAAEDQDIRLAEPLRQGADGEADNTPHISDQKRRDGAFIEIRETRLPNGSVVQTFTDITARHKAEAYIAKLASQDPLTSLDNRRAFRSKLQVLCNDPSKQFAVLFMDLDRFKTVNDTLGHRFGDLLLIGVSQRLQTVIEGASELARLGGDEFAILVPDVTDRDAVEALAQAVVATMAQPFEIERHTINCSISVGIAMGPQDGATEDELLVAADLALYSVKASGRGAYRFFAASMNDDAVAQREIEVDLRNALEEEQLELHYQPLFDLHENRVMAFEALARWKHPVRGMIPPDEFIPVAEDRGLIGLLGTWALREACQTAMTWPSELSVSVNVSPIQLANADLPSVVARILRETGLDPRRLTLEVTERIFLDNSQRTLSVLHDLKALGVRISLDDFGTGYSSLSYLRSFPFDTLKIDRSFISDLGASTSSSVIVQSVILIANGLGIKTVAEGIESVEQLHLLKLLGCDLVQGYHVSRPVPRDQVKPLLNSKIERIVVAA